MNTLKLWMISITLNGVGYLLATAGPLTLAALLSAAGIAAFVYRYGWSLREAGPFSVTHVPIVALGGGA